MASKHLPPELIAHSVSFLQTADTHDVCFGGRTNHVCERKSLRFNRCGWRQGL